MSVCGCSANSSQLPPSAAQTQPSSPAPSAPSESAGATAAGQALSGASELKAPNKQGNVAAKIAPEAEKTDAQKGKRDEWIRQTRAKIRELKDDIKQTKKAAKKKELKEQLTFQQNKLRKQLAADWLANTAYAAGARQEVVQQLDKSQIRMVSDPTLSSDAAYNERGNRILMKQSTVDQVMKDIASLDKKGIVDAETRKVLDPSRLKKTQEYRSLVIQQALMAHEARHAYDDHNGHSHGHNEQINGMIEQARKIEDPAQRKQAEEQVVREYIRQVELPAYTEQEKYQFEMGVAPRMSKWMTISVDPATKTVSGIAEDQAVDNILDWFRASGKPLSMEDVAGFVGHPLEGAKRPGAKRPGDSSPGQHTEGAKRPGAKRPADMLQGAVVEGAKRPGAKRPADALEGEVVEGAKRPGAKRPGAKRPGFVLDLLSAVEQRKAERDAEKGKA